MPDILGSKGPHPRLHKLGPTDAKTTAYYRGEPDQIKHYMLAWAARRQFEFQGEHREVDCGGTCIIKFRSGSGDTEEEGGVTNESLLRVMIHRLETFQAGPTACTENEAALVGLRTALKALQLRADRVAVPTNTTN